MNKTMKTCPWCGGSPSMHIEPLWHGNHGYFGSYSFEVRCCNCGATAPNGKFDTIYRSRLNAETEALERWNTRAPE